MEGLIPLMFKTIKKNRIRSKYRCLSTENAQSYNISDFYPFDHDHEHDHDHDQDQGPPRHRRFASTGVAYGINAGGGGGGGGLYELKEEEVDYYGDNIANNGGFGRFSTPYNNYYDNNKQQLKRFRSLRMFTCISGAT